MKLGVTVLLLLALAFVTAQEPAEVTAGDEVARDIDEDLDLLNLGLPEFADLEEATNQVTEDDLEEDEETVIDEDEDDVDEETDDDADEDEEDVEVTKRNQRGKWKRIRADRRRHRPGKRGRQRNSTETDEPRGHRHRGRRPGRNQQSIIDEDEDGEDGHHHRHRKDNKNNNGGHHRGRAGKRRHGGRRHRNGQNGHFRFNMTEAQRWEGATWQQKVDHVCGKLTRHKNRIERAQQKATANPRAQTRRERRIEFLGRMEKCCSQEQRDSCFYHLRHKVCEDRASIQPLRQDLPLPVRLAFSRIKCCRMRGWRRHMCFSTPFSSVHEFLRNHTTQPESTSQATIVESDVREQPDLDVMVGDMPVIEVGNMDDPIDDDADLFEDDDLEDSFDDLEDDDDILDEEEEDDEIIGQRRPHRGRKGHRGRHQARNKGRKMRTMYRKCCKAGKDEGLGVESDAEAATVCGDAMTTYLQNVRPRQLCRKAYEKCCLRAALP